MLLMHAPAGDLTDTLGDADLVACSENEQQILTNQKDKFMNMLTDVQQDRMPTADVKILDGGCVVQILSFSTSGRFQDYSNTVFLPYILRQLESVQRLGIVWNVYLAESLQAGTRQ